MVERIKVLVADDDPMILAGLRLTLDQYRDIELVRQIDNANNTISTLIETRADILVMDLRWYGDEQAGIDQIKRVRNEVPDVKIIAITAYQYLLEDAKLAGAHIGRRKGFSAKELVDDIRAVVKLPTESQLPMMQKLSSRESEILKLLADGLTDKAVGVKLSISESTVKSHVRSIFTKLDARNRAHAVSIGHKHHLIS